MDDCMPQASCTLFDFGTSSIVSIVALSAMCVGTGTGIPQAAVTLEASKLHV